MALLLNTRIIRKRSFVQFRLVISTNSYGLLFFSQIKEFSANTSNRDDTEKSILKSLQQLFTLLKPHEDFAVLAGDADTSAEMLEIIVNYLAKENKDVAHSKDEIKVTRKIVYLIAFLYT